MTLTATAAFADSSRNLPEVTVEAQRADIEKRAYTFVWRITKQVGEDQSLARWHMPVCALVAGLPRDQGEYILQRISTIAHDAGAPLASGDCKPNFFVMVSVKPTSLVKAWGAREPRIFGKGSPAAINRFLNSARPIRVWYNVTEDGADGTSFSTFDTPGSGYEFPANQVKDLSKLTFSAVQNIDSVIVAIDYTQMKDRDFGAMADYVAMVGLSEINLDADLSDNASVLRMFDGPAAAATATYTGTVGRTEGLSAFDTGFLKALYNTPQSYRKQRTLIYDRLVSDIAR